MIKTELKYADIKENDLIKYQGKINEVHKMIQDKTGKGSDFLGWKDWPLNYDKNEIEKIKQSALRIQETSQVLVVCGIGGSYLGAVSGIELLKGIIPNKDIEIIYFGNTFSSLYVSQVLDYLKNKSFSVNVISKSGTTTETSIAFRLLKQLLKEKYGEDYYKRIYATTDKYKGTLKAEADLKGYETFTIPDDIGGRFSVLTSVGLLPFASAKLDIEQILLGAQKARIDLQNSNILENESYKYAVARYILLEKGYKSELYVTYEPHLAKFSEWLKQLFGESEGKDGKALLPDSVLFSTDLHSLGQFIQDGSKMLFETNIRFEQPLKDIIIPSDNENLDNLNYLQDKSLNYVNEKAFLGTLSAHYEEGKVPNIILSAQEINEFTYGYLVYFFFISCATSAYLLDVNPFNQPGVEIYKKKMFELLGKPK
ncbi:MAG: glucose-6-phosphate isomerase [Bacillales bacterium]|nr:glucose-6-phosphate isomerase [Bacillales bacterium]